MVWARIVGLLVGLGWDCWIVGGSGMGLLDCCRIVTLVEAQGQDCWIVGLLGGLGWDRWIVGLLNC